MVTEKEFHTVVYTINKFQHYIIGYLVFVHTNNYVIKYLMNKPLINGRITRWLVLLQEFDFTVIDKHGKDNVVEYFLYRLTNNSDDTPIQDCFLDERLFAISTHSPQYVDISNYLATRKLPHHLSPREKWKIVQQSAQYS